MNPDHNASEAASTGGRFIDTVHGPASEASPRFINTGHGPTFQPVDIGHSDYLALIEPDSAFWSLVKKDKLGHALTDSSFLDAYRAKAGRFREEMDGLRFGLTPSAVYFNPTERCNLNCTYCYIPGDMRSKGIHMSPDTLLDALSRLKAHFTATMPEGRKPQIIFHGAEPLMNREAVFQGIEAFKDDFRFGVQTNATLLDEQAVEFLTERNVGVGISLDGVDAAIADSTRKTWSGEGVSHLVRRAMDMLRGYSGFNVICTVTAKNIATLPEVVEFFHTNEVETCLLNIVRCTLPGAREIMPGDQDAGRQFVSALERSHELYRETGRKLVVANFANILLAIMAPTARRLMCDISPCGGGRCFFALAPNGDMFPCSEFIGLPHFKGGNLFTDAIGDVLQSAPFAQVTGRKVEDITPCNRCAIRHFCGSPCPAEAIEMNGAMNRMGAFCGFYEDQTRYALRLIADGKADDFLWDGWDSEAETVFELTGL
ncbi:peptide-modifying radical SAM enzyme CbpB [Fundidesulfovibrio putealis]|uniref:peptide-modifying radical SAM enzyme CbpB n=1 Tax=Fundidesulfovibrio putealis TaxID=270496 RepID=UPI0003F98525|nr:peptide-modifying radical SAM enzyme CbpB [Fundidesulfovibrio putealis]